MSEASKSKDTVRAYRTGALASSTPGAQLAIESSLPASPATVAAFLAGCADRGLRGVDHRTQGQRDPIAHKARGFNSPTAAAEVEATLAGIRREIGMASTQKAPATATAIAVMLSHINTTSMIGKRDRALLAIGFAGSPPSHRAGRPPGRGYRLHRKLGTRR